MPTPLDRRPPPFPASCEIRDGAEEEFVALMFDVARDGEVQNVRVAGSSNACFEEVAVGAARQWLYEPYKRKDADAYKDLETSVVFRQANAEPFISPTCTKPIELKPPRLRAACFKKAGDLEKVFVVFDVLPDGSTDNVRVVKSPYRCFNPPTLRAVKKWRYAPLPAGTPRIRGVRTVLAYQFSSDIEARRSNGQARAINRSLRRARSLLDKGDRPQEVLDQLAVFEEEYTDEMTRQERAAFHRFRGWARLQLKDYSRALDDFRVAQASAQLQETKESLDSVIVQLEATLDASPHGALKYGSDEVDESSDASASGDDAGSSQQTETN
ncbi:MAG: TonB family protein [Pseudomonadota bacterium]